MEWAISVRCASECRSKSMKGITFENMSTDELWTLHNKIAETLAARIADEKSILEKRLSQLTQRFQTVRPQAHEVVGHIRESRRNTVIRTSPPKNGVAEANSPAG